jgi:hypothetical protein
MLGEPYRRSGGPSGGQGYKFSVRQLVTIGDRRRRRRKGDRHMIISLLTGGLEVLNFGKGRWFRAQEGPRPTATRT